MRAGKALAIKRINKDMNEITKSPIEGIGIVSIDNDPMKYVVNLCLMTGIYNGYCIQLLLTFTDNYPTKPPKILIFPNQAINNEYHHHIFPDHSVDENGHYFKKFCFDLLDNDFMSTNTEHSGWNPSYSISSLLLQVQNFIGDPDLPKSHLPNKGKIKQLMDSMDTYTKVFKIKEDNKEKKIIHTWKNPYPKMYFKKNENKKEDEINTNPNINENEKEKEDNIQLIKENLTCFMLKLNYIEDPDILLGYPIIQKKGLGKNKIELFPIPEMLTYDGFMAQIGKQDSKLDYYFDTQFKSANNEYYNYWVPIYIDKNHYFKNRTAILNSFSIIKYGPRGIKEYDFKPEQIFEILPIILNKMIIGMFNGQSSISSAFIRCYFHYVLLFKKLSIEFEDEFINYLNHKLNLIHKNKYNIKKSIIPDIGDFFVLLFFCNRNTHTEKMKKMWYCLFEELLVRQIFWIFNDKNNKKNIIELILQDGEEIEKQKKISMKKIEKETLKECFEEGYITINTKDNKTFVDLLEKYGFYSRIASYFYGVYDIKYEKEKTKNKFINNLQKLFDQANSSTKINIYKFLMESNKKQYFEEYFELSNEGKKIFSNRISYKEKKLIENIRDNIISNSDYLKKTKEELLNDNKYLNNIYQAQKGNKLLLITFFAQKKMEEKGFMTKLEKNYGIYLEVDNFIKEMKEKLSEIKTYSQFFEYIGSEFGKDKNDVELIKYAYEKAKSKNYIRENNDNNTQNIHSINNSSNFYRGRGIRGSFRGFRGRGRGRGRGGF